MIFIPSSIKIKIIQSNNQITKNNPLINIRAENNNIIKNIHNKLIIKWDHIQIAVMEEMSSKLQLINQVKNQH